ncbi:MAG: DUF2231 domain-containing protein [Candidatus Neomarinimicrobiota bacterium]
MSLFIPDWAPNIHPLIVHFPIVLLMAAVILHFFSLVFPRSLWLKTVTPYAFMIGIVTAIITYFTGRAAADSVYLPPDANLVLSLHSDYALITVIIFGIVTLMQLAVLLRKGRKAVTLQLLSFIVGVSGLVLLFKTGEQGGKMVFKYGVGTTITDKNTTILSTMELNRDSVIVLQENGSWYWNMTNTDIDNQFEGFNWLRGSQTNVRISRLQGVTPGLSMSSVSGKVSILLEAGERTGGVQVNVSLDMGNFDGTFFIAHHIQSHGTYDYLSYNGSKISLGRIEDGEIVVLQEKKIESTEAKPLYSLLGQEGINVVI